MFSLWTSGEEKPGGPTTGRDNQVNTVTERRRGAEKEGLSEGEREKEREKEREREKRKVAEYSMILKI